MKYIVVERYADNGEFSHYDLINTENGETAIADIDQALQLQQTGVIKSVCNHCNNQLCDSQTFNQQCFKCGKKPQ